MTNSIIERLKCRYALGVVDRRQFLMAALATGATLPLALSMADDVQAGAPKKGGTLKIGLSGGATTDSLDPATYLDTHMYAVGFTLGNSLVELGADKKPIPELAESWESADHTRKWVFKIRKGVEFHNGKTLTPADVVYSLSRHIAEDSKSAAKAFLSDVTSIKADGDNVIIEHATGDADIPVILGDYHLQIVPEGFTDWVKFVGTGAYVLEAFDPGVRFTATRNPNYWKPDRGWVDRVEMLNLLDQNARSTALITGQINVIDRVDNKVIDRIKAIDKFDLIETVGGRYETTVMDVRKAPFNDVNVREAVKYAINREQQVNKIFRGYAVMGNDHPIPPSDPFYNTDLAQRPYDPEKSNWHLKQAGLDSLEIELSASDAAYPGAVNSAVLMQADTGRTNLKLKVARVANDGYWSNVWMKSPFCMSNWSTRPTPGMMFSVAFACGQPWAEAFWCDDKFEKLLIEGKTETDFEKRKAIYWEMQEICHNSGGNAVFAFVSDIDAYAKTVKGAVPDGVGRLNGARIAERVWME